MHRQDYRRRQAKYTENKWIFNIFIKTSYDFQASSGEVAELKGEYSLGNFDDFEAATW